jgi:hypothetical protein
MHHVSVERSPLTLKLPQSGNCSAIKHSSRRRKTVQSTGEEIRRKCSPVLRDAPQIMLLCFCHGTINYMSSEKVQNFLEAFGNRKEEGCPIFATSLHIWVCSQLGQFLHIPLRSSIHCLDVRNCDGVRKRLVEDFTHAYLRLPVTET